MHPVFARAALAVAAALAAGCTSTSERLYYQTRYLPTEGGDALYASGAHAGDEVYELPSHPPGDEHVARRNCLPPGVRFKELPLVGIKDSNESTGQGGGEALGGWDERPQPIGYLDTGHLQPLGAQADADHGPARVVRFDQQAGAFDARARSRTGAGLGVLRSDKLGADRPQDKLDWCLDPQLPPETTPARAER